MRPNEPPAALEHTIEARERLDARGGVVAELDETALRADLRELLDGQSVDALCVSLLHSYANPRHERRVRELAREVAPEVPVTLSSDVLPELGEYERTLTAAINAWVGPEVRRYLDRLQTRLGAERIKSPVNMLRSDGGLMSLEQAHEKPAHILLSGPAGGVVGALWSAHQAGLSNILTCDVGGTSTDVALCQGGAPDITRQTEVGPHSVRVPSVDVRSVGAGGGSIASVAPLTGALRVGPRSAGAEPGPACYGRGGTEPTLTDANVVLGYLPPRLLGGEMVLDVEAARRAIQTIADALRLEVVDAAAAIVHIANENMLGALRLVSVQRGHDPRDFALLAFGGAGPLHGNALGRLLGSTPVVIPPGAGLLCALGDVSTTFREEFSRSVLRTFDDLTPSDLVRTLEELGAQAEAWFVQQSVAPGGREVRFEIDVRYFRQGHALTQSVELQQLRGRGLSALAQAFDDDHDRRYGFRLADALREIVVARAVALGATPALPAVKLAEAPSADASAARIDQRPTFHEAYFDGRWLTTPVYERARLLAGHSLAGPAVVVEMDSTTLIEPGWEGTVDRQGTILIRPRASHT
jgi:N-methylhydantoinase A